ncbi:hypothetical protein DBA26_08995 [Brucella canis]|uniref:Uncharacterized protein n=1 Tax=Brucella canis (strain ATCC 23365 / NCTC 10854 / RM-666) TaxID=483179 RepID=A9M8P0_BRUC2|nr:Hypothetical protein BCAN_A1948 [Brucella canis ATCC 23365]ATN20688.1 hypothetical protein CRN66_13140 [Brucella canis]AVO72612.1 hypothetical protein C6Y57_12485 [Brucella canis]RXX14989.1 hypothetical protein DBA27_03585 [Brucella canis]RXX15975.1 hypothetical protein DBA26_08995 [Brucella canis]
MSAGEPDGGLSETQFDVALEQGCGTFDPAPGRPKKYGGTVTYGLMGRFLLRFHHDVKEAFSRKA